MMPVGPATRIFLAVGATDLRKSPEGLSDRGRHRCGQDPLSGHLFVLANRTRTRLKVALLGWQRVVVLRQAAGARQLRGGVDAHGLEGCTAILTFPRAYPALVSSIQTGLAMRMRCSPSHGFLSRAAASRLSRRAAGAAKFHAGGSCGSEKVETAVLHGQAPSKPQTHVGVRAQMTRMIRNPPLGLWKPRIECRSRGDKAELIVMGVVGFHQGQVPASPFLQVCKHGLRTDRKPAHMPQLGLSYTSKLRSVLRSNAAIRGVEPRRGAKCLKPERALSVCHQPDSNAL